MTYARKRLLTFCDASETHEVASEDVRVLLFPLAHVESHLKPMAMLRTVNKITKKRTYMTADVKKEHGLKVWLCAHDHCLKKYISRQSAGQCVTTVIKELTKWA